MLLGESGAEETEQVASGGGREVFEREKKGPKKKKKDEVRGVAITRPSKAFSPNLPSSEPTFLPIKLFFPRNHGRALHVTRRLRAQRDHPDPP